MSAVGEYEEGLKRIRQRQRRMRHVLFGIVPFVLVGAYAYGRELPADLTIAVIVAAAAYGALLLGYSLRLALTECPRCERFYHWNWWSDPFTQRCLNCGLRLEPGRDVS